MFRDRTGMKKPYLRPDKQLTAKFLSMRTKLKSGEKIVITIRRHWLVLTWPVVITVLALAIGITAAALGAPYGLLLPAAAGLWLWYKVVQRDRDLWAVTNLRVVDESGVITLNSKESPLEKINNVTYSQTGWGRIFGYGNIQIQTAAEIGSTTYTMVSSPKELKDTITEMQESYKRDQITAQARELASAIAGSQRPAPADVAAEIERLHNLKERGILTEEEFVQQKRRILG